MNKYFNYFRITEIIKSCIKEQVKIKLIYFIKIKYKNKLLKKPKSLFKICECNDNKKNTNKYSQYLKCSFYSLSKIR